MKKSILLFLLSFTIGSTWGQSIGSTTIGDTLYIWAKSGLNVRAQPSTKAKVLTTLPYGDSIQLKSTCGKSYHVMGIEQTETWLDSGKIDPVIFKGCWVKIQTAEGVIGYTISQYLLPLAPKSLFNINTEGINVAAIQVDTIYKHKDPVTQNAEDLSFTTKTTFSNGISLIQKNSEIWGESTYTFPANLTIDQVLIMFSSRWDNYKNCAVLRNWEEEIVITESEICELKVKKKNEVVVLSISCSC